MSIYYPPSAENTTYAYFLADGSIITGTYYGDVYIAGGATMSANVVIKGNLTIEGTLSGPGLDLTVTGDLIGRLPGFTPVVDLSGAAGQAGGTLEVSGQICSCALLLNGGSSSTGNAGNGGILYCNEYISGDGTFSETVDVSLVGGDCTSTTAGHSAGAGGSVYCRGTFAVDGSLLLSGGARSGTLTGMGTGSKPNGGALYVGGDLISADNIELSGGSNNAVPSDADAGDAGVISVLGDSCVSTITFDGGDITAPTSTHNAGNGTNGNTYFAGDFTGEGGQVSSKGGSNSGSGTGGNGGNLFIQGDYNGPVTILKGGATLGNGTGGAGTGNGGSGGTLGVVGFAAVTTISCGGGNSGTANGGNGGTIALTGGKATGVDISGGSSGDGGLGYPGGGRGGNGGSFTSSGRISLDSCTTSGGGNIGASGSADGGNGGNIVINDDCFVTTGFTLSGGDASGGSSGNGGTGGSLTIAGSSCLAAVESKGGQAGSGNGQSGGVLEFLGFVSVSGEISANGGNSASGTAGGAGSVLFRAGVSSIAIVETLDGTGTAPSSGGGVALEGSCVVKEINVTDRAALKIKAGGDTGATLKVGSVPGKHVLTNGVGSTDTASITAMVADSVFGYDCVGDAWYRHQGTAI